MTLLTNNHVKRLVKVITIIDPIVLFSVMCIELENDVMQILCVKSHLDMAKPLNSQAIIFQICNSFSAVVKHTKRRH